MSFTRHPELRVQRLRVGKEGEPLLVVDNVLADPEEVFELAASKSYATVSTYYPGVRARVPLSLQHFLLEVLRDECVQTFGVGPAVRFTSCHFSLITTPPEQLTYIQRIPHVDSLVRSELALILYLFTKDLGGTAFYRHRKTGYEWVDESRKVDYFGHVEMEKDAIARSGAGYIAGDTEFYERIGSQDGVFNRMLVYRRTTLHSAQFGKDFVLSSNPRQGRISINGFLA